MRFSGVHEGRRDVQLILDYDVRLSRISHQEWGVLLTKRARGVELTSSCPALQTDIEALVE